MNNCVIISGGKISKNDLSIDESDFVIAADSGYRFAKKYNVKVDLVVGDFDSLHYIPQEIEIKKLNKIKDDTDTFSAVKEGIERGYKNFIFYGALGKREEHSLANISILLYLKNRGFAGKIVSNSKNFIVLKDESINLPSKKKGFISIFSISEKSEGVSIKNLKYELINHTLTNDFALGIDNEYINLAPTISVKNGTILVIY